MTDVDIKDFGFFMLRAPAQHEGIANWIVEAETAPSITDRLLQLYALPVVKDALFLASPAFALKLQQELTNGKPSRKCLLTLYKYLIRMSTRATPFGKFSGIALGAIAPGATRMLTGGNHQSYLRYNMEFMDELSMAPLTEKMMKEQSVFYPNGTIYRCSDQYRYYEFTYDGVKRNYKLSVSRATGVLDFILEVSTNGLNYSSIVQCLLDAGISEDKAIRLTDALIENQILVSNLTPSITGSPYGQHLISRLEKNGSKKHADVLNVVKKRFSKAFFPPNPQLELKPLKSILGDKPYDPFHVDTKLNTKNVTLNQAVADTINREVKELLCLVDMAGISEMDRFKRQFRDRYGDQEVDLMKAIDPDIGIGYDETNLSFASSDPVINHIDFQHKSTQPVSLFNAIKSVMTAAGIRNGESAINLASTQFSQFSDKSRLAILPPSFYLFGSLLAEEGEDEKKNNGQFRFHLLGLGGASSLPLMARFAHTDPKLEQKLADLAAYEKESMGDAIIAEIVHLSQPKTANILQRPCFFEYEIPILTSSTLPREKQVPLADLTLSISAGRLVLKSKQLNSIVIPRLSNAHNHKNGISVYRFLSDLQYEGWSPGWRWQWQGLDLDFLPRVTYKHLLLSRAQWNLKPEIYDQLSTLPSDAVHTYLKKKFNIPKLVQLAHGDNELLLNLASEFGAAILLNHLKRHTAVLFEVLPTHADSLADEKGNRYRNEVVLPLQSTNRPHFEKLKEAKPPTLQRVFTPGQQWTYLKIYCSTRQADKLLAGSLSNVIEHLKKDKAITDFFFIRYYDPEPHLRLRFKCSKNPTDAFAQIAQQMNITMQPLIDAGFVRQIQYDTYERELERYGEKYMEYCEAIFCLDSSYVIKFLRHDALEADRASSKWLFSMGQVNALLTQHGLELQEKLLFVKKLRNGLLNEFELKKETTRRLNDAYRSIKPAIESFFSNSLTSSYLKQIHQLIDEKSEELKKLADGHFGQTSKPCDAFFSSTLPSLCHMLINRIFSVKQRESELTVYHFLEKIYLRQLALEKQNRNTPATVLGADATPLYNFHQ